MRSLEYAKNINAKVCGIVSRDGGYTAQVADACVVIPTINSETLTPHTQGFQAVTWHLLVSHPDLQKYDMKWGICKNKVKAIILAAGKGKRLGELTKKLPKPMIEIDGKPVLEHNLEMCRKAGVNDIYINLHHLPDKIRNYFSDGSKFNVNITYNFEKRLLGTAGALLPFKNSLKDDPFFVIYGDNYINYDLSELKLFHEKKKADVSILFHWRSDISNSGIAIIDSNDRISTFVEKPLDTNHNGDWVNAGIYYIEANDIINLIQPNNDFGVDIFPKIVKHGL